jgi:hypothetical protein
VCKCVLYYCHRVTTQLQLINISYHLVRLLIAFYGKRIAVAVFTKPDGSSLYYHSVFCSKLIETKTSGTVRADLINIELLVTSHGQIRQQNLRHLASNPYENVAEFKYLGMTLTNQNCRQEKNCGERSVNACCRSVQNSCILVCCITAWRSRCTKRYNCLFCVGVKLCLPHEGKSVA